MDRIPRSDGGDNMECKKDGGMTAAAGMELGHVRPTKDRYAGVDMLRYQSTGGGMSLSRLRPIFGVGTHARDHEGTEHGPTSNHTHSKRAAVHAFILGTWGYALQS